MRDSAGGGAFDTPGDGSEKGEWGEKDPLLGWPKGSGNPSKRRSRCGQEVGHTEDLTRGWRRECEATPGT